MVRFPVSLLLLVAAAALPAWAQIQPRSLQTIDDPRGEFSISLRFSGNVSVAFRDVGTLATRQDIGDLSSEATRFYDDGAVAIDQRRAGDGSDLPDDGRTNTWRMSYSSQIRDMDQNGTMDSVAFHRYQTRSDGASIEAESTQVPGLDLDYSYSFGKFGGRLRNKSPRATWGGTVGLGLASVNAKVNGSVQATLLTDEDFYSLDGATPPNPPYTAPSTGMAGSVSVDTTVLLANRPYLRISSDPNSSTPEKAEVDGFWQVRGGAVTGRAGVWGRYRPAEKIALRLGLGLQATYLGLEMRYDEWLDKAELVNQLRYQNETKPEKSFCYGAYGSLEAEFWLTGSTALFLGATYENIGQDIEIPLDGRTAEIRIGSGSGFRLGITKLF